MGIFGGLTAKNIQESSLKTKDTARVNSNGKMAVSTKENGAVGNNTVLGTTETAKEKKRKASGLMEEESNGSPEIVYFKITINVFIYVHYY